MESRIMNHVDKVVAVLAAVALSIATRAAGAAPVQEISTLASAGPAQQVAVGPELGLPAGTLVQPHVGFRFDGSAKAIPSLAGDTTEFGNAWGGGGKFTLIYPNSHVGLSIGLYTLTLTNNPAGANGYFYNIPLEVSYNFNGLFNSGIGGNDLESYVYIGNEIDVFQNLGARESHISVANPTAGIGFRYFVTPSWGINVQLGGRASISGTVSNANRVTRYQFVPTIGITARI